MKAIEKCLLEISFTYGISIEKIYSTYLKLGSIDSVINWCENTGYSFAPATEKEGGIYEAHVTKINSDGSDFKVSVSGKSALTVNKTAMMVLNLLEKDS